MAIHTLLDNINGSLWLCLNILRWVGYLVPDDLIGWKKIAYPFYFFFWFMFINGIYVITQTGALIQAWGNISEMTETTFVLLTNLALTTKVINVVLRRRAVLDIINEGDRELRTEIRIEGVKIINHCNKETVRLMNLYIFLGMVSVLGWATSAEKGQLPLRAWYPFDVSTFPMYHLIYSYQCVAIVILAFVSISADQLVTSLTAVSRCRLQLVSLSLRTLCEGFTITNNFLTPIEEEVVKERLRSCVQKIQAALNTTAQLQKCFSVPILAQFTVSSFIICVTAYQLAMETSTSYVRLLSMWAYLFGLALQVFLYCYQAHYLSEESGMISMAAYECPWYVLSVPLRRSLLVVMVRARRLALITAGGFVTLSLDCFVSIIKASYSFFTVLQQMQE